MAHRLEVGHRTISWTETKKIIIGHRDCGVCGTETPEPTMDMMIEFAKSNLGCFMWPDSREACTMPPNWTDDREIGLICPDCTAAKNAAFAARKKETSGKSSG